MNSELFQAQGEALIARIIGFIKTDPDATPVVALGAFMTLSARMCVILELPPVSALQGFAIALKDAHDNPPQGPVQ